MGASFGPKQNIINIRNPLGPDRHFANSWARDTDQIIEFNGLNDTWCCKVRSKSQDNFKAMLDDVYSVSTTVPWPISKDWVLPVTT